MAEGALISGAGTLLATPASLPITMSTPESGSAALAPEIGIVSAKLTLDARNAIYITVNKIAKRLLSIGSSQSFISLYTLLFSPFYES
jgi:hypothetical protein